MIIRDNLFIGGEWVTPSGTEWLEVVNPATEGVFARVPAATTEDVDRAVEAARLAFDHGPWPKLSVAERAEYLRSVMRLFDKRVADAVDQQIDEMGATHGFATATTTAMAPFLERVISDADSVPMRERRQGVAGPVEVLREPLGVSAGVIPWNAPLMVAVTKLFPALLMGCPMIVKPAPESPLSIYLLAEAIEEAGLPRGVVSIVPGGREVGEHLVSHSGVDKVTFTGSTQAGRRIAAICGGQLKAVTLELGGKSAAILTPGVDLARHIPAVVGNALGNAGQMCIATGRVLVHESQVDAATEALVGHIAAMKVGNPHERDTAFGPLVAQRQRARVEGYVASAVSEGATLVLGGKRPEQLPTGWYFEPTVFTDVHNKMTVAQEEIFGPVVCVIPYRTEDEAVEIANDSDYGLGGGVYSEDIDHALELASRIRTGTVSVNDAPPSGGGGPFGGYKNSGVGRERAAEGLMTYTELKSVALPAG